MRVKSLLKAALRGPWNVWKALVSWEHALARRRGYARAMLGAQRGVSVVPSSSSHQPRDLASGPVLVAVYRHANGQTLHALIGQSFDSVEIRLWALDQIHELLRPWTVGHGPGQKYDLINTLTSDIPGSKPIIVSDDDIVMEKGDLLQLVSIGTRANFGLYQASHARSSFSSYRITVRRHLTHARATTFVEIGPLFVLSPQWRDRFLPFSEGLGMGWGLEIEWYGISRSGCRFGIVDDVRIIHLAAAGSSYRSYEEERARLERAVVANGVTLEEIQKRVGTWWRWQSRPPWAPG